MSKSMPSSVTIEEAVAHMVNLDYIPTGFSLLDMTAAFLEEAEVEYENAMIARLSDNDLATLKMKMEICKARNELAHSLLSGLSHEVMNRENSMVVISEESSSQLRLTLVSVTDWANEKFGIGMPDWAQNVAHAEAARDGARSVRWEEVTIKIYADYRIGCRVGLNDWLQSSFREIDLMGMRKNDPNKKGAILIGLSMGKKYPVGRGASSADKTAISQLRCALEKLTGCSDDPFLPFNESDGWKPRFTLIDDRRNADERAKARAQLVSLDETRDFENENDDTQKWLDENK